MIDFEIPEKIAGTRLVVETVAVNMMRPVSRYFDEHEHEIPWDYINFMHTATRAMGGTSMAAGDGKKEGPRFGFQRLAVMVGCFPGVTLEYTWIHLVACWAQQQSQPPAARNKKNVSSSASAERLPSSMPCA